MSSIEKQVRHEVQRASEGHTSALGAVRFALASGRYAAIGTARSEEAHEPSIPLTAYATSDSPEWRFSLLDEAGGLEPLTLMSTIGRPAVWAAIGGDRNVALQRFRIDRPLTPEGKRYKYGTHGHIPSTTEPEGCELLGHKDLVEALERYKNSEDILGAVDLVRVPEPDELFRDVLTDDPGHIAIRRAAITELRVPVRGPDVRTLGHISIFEY